MNRCPNCGNRLSKIDVLCSRCGTVVEIVQAKNNIPLRPGNVDVSEGVQQNKDYSQTLIVYNEDFPSGGFAEKEEGIKAPERREEPYIVDGRLPSSHSAGPNFKTEDVAGPDKDLADPNLKIEADPDKDLADTHYKIEADPDKDLAGQSIKEETPPSQEYSVEDTYSERYLEKIKGMSPLPEIVEICDFDPEEFMREYKENNPAYKDISAGPIPENADTQATKKQWLEIEESAPPRSATVPPPQQASEPAPAAPVAAEGYRYRGRTKPATVNADTIGVPPGKKLSRKRMPLILSILLWIIVSAAFLFCFIFFDSYVKTAYGGYGSFVYSITNGKVDLGTGALNNK